MCPSDFFPLGDIRYKHPGANHIVQRISFLRQNRLNLFNDVTGLFIKTTFTHYSVLIDGNGARDLHLVAYPHRPGITNQVFPLGTGRNVLALCHFLRIRSKYRKFTAEQTFLELDFSKQELERYSRHLVLPQFGAEAQKKLKQSAVLVVGAGGLGSPVLSYLAAAGVGRIGVIDHDTVSRSNLQRQVLYTEKDLGRKKAHTAAVRIERLNPDITVKSYDQKITHDNALELLKDYQVVVDCTDNFPTRYLVNDACVLAGIPLVYGSIFRYEGQVAVFNYNHGPNYRDLYPRPPAPGSVPDCEQGGVLGVLPGIVGSVQANEAIKLITGIGAPLAGKLWLLDSLSMDTRIIQVADRNQRAEIKKLINYDDFCSAQTKIQTTDMKEVTVSELKKMIDNKEDFQLIDVREPHEFDICNIQAELIPLSEIPNAVDKISRDKKVVVHCRSGSRSGNAIKWLEKNYQFENLYNLKGGVLAWADEIDPSMTKY